MQLESCAFGGSFAVQLEALLLSCCSSSSSVKLISKQTKLKFAVNQGVVHRARLIGNCCRQCSGGCAPCTVNWELLQAMFCMYKVSFFPLQICIHRHCVMQLTRIMF